MKDKDSDCLLKFSREKLMGISAFLLYTDERLFELVSLTSKSNTKNSKLNSNSRSIV